MALTKAADPKYRRLWRGMEPLSAGSFAWGNEYVDGEFGRTLAASHKSSEKGQKANRRFFPDCSGRHTLTKASYCGYHTPIHGFDFLLFASLT